MNSAWEECPVGSPILRKPTPTRHPLDQARSLSAGSSGVRRCAGARAGPLHRTQVRRRDSAGTCPNLPRDVAAPGSSGSGAAPRTGALMKRLATTKTAAKSWTVYLVRCRDDSLYTGITNDLDCRLRRHNAGTASRYTRSRRPVTLVYRETASDRSSALRREAAIKKLPRREKMLLVGQQSPRLRRKTPRRARAKTHMK